MDSLEQSVASLSVSATPITGMLSPTLNIAKDWYGLSQDVKSATPQYVLFDDEDIDENFISERLFEDFSAHELSLISRSDLINGVPVSYTPIKNLALINKQFNPNNIIKLQDTSEEYFARFPIKLNNKIPNVGTGTNGKSVYLDSEGNLIIDLVNMESSEQVEVNIVISGTIYEATL